MRDALELVIFDCDGVLVDTEPLTNTVMARTVSALGWAMTMEDSIRLLKGRSLEAIQAMVEARVGAPQPGFADTYRAAMFEQMARTPVGMIEGASAVLDALDSADSPARCVASNGPVRKMQVSLTSAGLLERFATPGDRTLGHLPGYALFSACEINRFKPDPGVFVCAAHAMGVQAGACLVVEDSPAGVEAGRRAGMRVVALAGLTPAEELARAGAHRVIGALDELLGAISAAT